jgi:EmrB/QacA subfamily drug resistance transporter
MTSKAIRGWVLALTSVASLMVALDTLVVTTALSTIKSDLGASIEQLEWTVNAYNLSFAVLLMTAAAVGDRLGRRRLFAAGLALLSAAFPPERRATALGIFSGITGLAVASGPLVGGAIAEGIAWEWIFWVNVPIGLVLIPLVLARMAESHGDGGAVDARGLALVTAGAFGIVWGLVRGNAAGWGSLEIVAALAGGALLSIAFVAWELRAPDPMLPMRFFRSRAFSSGNAVGFLLFASLFSAVFFLAQFLQAGLGYGPFEAGLRLVPWTATLSICAPLAGALADRFGERPFMVAGLLLQAVGMAWIALIAEPGLAYGEMVAPLIVAGCGVSMAIPSAQSSAVGAVDPAAIGKAAGTNSMMRQLGGVFGIAIAVAVFTGAGSYATAEEFSDGFAAATGIAAGLALLGALAGSAMPGRRRPAPRAELATEAAR